MTDGEVAVRQNGQEHAVSVDLEGQILTDLDGEEPVVHLPPEVGVVYHDHDEEADDVAADGSGVERTDVEMRGYGLDEDLSAGSMLVGVALLVGAGSVIGGGSSEVVGLAMLVGGAALAYIGARSYWSNRT